ncbi:MAG: hypothetical protein IIB12_02755, partial [Chloroflexi bacterium]|nr:hypothetical protein [Chloroflexota bacterium]
MWRLAGYGVAGLAFLAPTGAWRLVASIAAATGRITTDVVVTYASALGSMGRGAADAASRWSQRRREAMARRTYVTAAVDEASAPPWLEPEPPPPTLEPPPAPIEAVALEEPEEEPASVDDLPKPEMAPEKEPVAPVPAVPAASPPVSAGALAGSIMLEAASDAGGWRLPSLDILDHAPASVPSQTDNEARARLLEQSLSSYGIDASVVDFDKYVALRPKAESRQWERGISDYYAKKYKQGAKQFELYQTYHDNDVENSTWRYLCMARTEGVEAARNALATVDRDGVKNLFFATTNPPYQEKLNAATVHAALGLNASVRALDVTGSARAGLSALFTAADLNATSVVTMADIRLGAPEGAVEQSGGDGAAAFVIGSENVIAEITATYSETLEHEALWRLPGETFAKSWEDRFALTQIYTPLLTSAIQNVLGSAGIAAGDLAKVIIAVPNPRATAGVTRSMKLGELQIDEPFLESIGHTG